MKTSSHDPTDITAIQRKTTVIFESYGVDRAYLFGSFARGDQSTQSDIDVRIDKGRLRGLLALGSLQMDLEETLQHKVDLLTSDSLDSDFMERIKQEEVLIYERKTQ
ncbi:MAG: nucleotidyltransferase family protein [Thermoguttaceae bacterium]